MKSYGTFGSEPNSSHGVAVFSTTAEKHNIIEPWLELALFGNHYSGFLFRQPHEAQDGSYFLTADTHCKIKNIVHVKTQEIDPTNPMLVIAVAMNCAEEQEWAQVELPLVRSSMNKDSLEQQQEDALQMLKALDQARKTYQHKQVELFIRFTDDQAFAANIFANNGIPLMRWDGSDYIPANPPIIK